MQFFSKLGCATVSAGRAATLVFPRAGEPPHGLCVLPISPFPPRLNPSSFELSAHSPSQCDEEADYEIMRKLLKTDAGASSDGSEEVGARA